MLSIFILRINKEDGVRELWRLRHDFYPTLLQIFLYNSGPEVATPPMLQQVEKCQRTQVDADDRIRHVRQRHIMLKLKISTPINKDIRLGIDFGTHEYQLLLKYLHHLHPWPVIRLMDQCGIHDTSFQLFMQMPGIQYRAFDCQLRVAAPDRSDPVEEQGIPQARLSTKRNEIICPIRQG